MTAALAPTAAGLVAASALSLAASVVLVTRLERLGVRLGLSEALLGLVAALAADGPEITSAVTALVRGQHDVGIGVVVGSNVFNLAALLGVGALVAGRIALHRDVVVLEGALALWVCAVTSACLAGLVGPGVGLLLVAVALGPYVAVAAAGPARTARLPGPGALRAWLARALTDETAELAGALEVSRGTRADGVVAGAAVVVVVGASVVMERTATSLGHRAGLSEIVVGALILAAVTSLPNAVAAVHLARRGRGAATLSAALNSNTLNAAVGLLLPAAFVGLGQVSTTVTAAAAWWAGLTVLALALAYAARGLGRRAGALIVVAYAGFAALVVWR
jgi:cation:H+ antiporter